MNRADIIAGAHFIWILVGLISLPLLFALSWWYVVTLIFASITILSWIVFRGCIFTQLENRWRLISSKPVDEKSFLQHYLKKFLHVNVPRPAIGIVIYSYMAALLYLSLRQAF